MDDEFLINMILGRGVDVSSIKDILNDTVILNGMTYTVLGIIIDAPRYINNINTFDKNRTINLVKDHIGRDVYYSDDTIMSFVEGNIYPVVKEALELGADVNLGLTFDTDKIFNIYYPITYAVFNKFESIFNLLIEYGADLTLNIDTDDQYKDIWEIVDDYGTREMKFIGHINIDNDYADKILNTQTASPLRMAYLKTQLCLYIYDQNNRLSHLVENSLYAKRDINIDHFLDIFNLNLSQRLNRRLLDVILPGYSLSSPKINNIYNTLLTSNLDRRTRDNIVITMLDNDIRIRSSVLYDLMNSNIDVSVKDRLRRLVRRLSMFEDMMPSELQLEISKFID